MKRAVLSEEEYLERLEGVLKRQFYPELSAGKSQDETLTVEEFQTRYTTEDDASFGALLDKLNAQRQQRNERRFHNPDNLDPLRRYGAEYHIEPAAQLLPDPPQKLARSVEKPPQSPFGGDLDARARSSKSARRLPPTPLPPGNKDR